MGEGLRKSLQHQWRYTSFLIRDQWSFARVLQLLFVYATSRTHDLVPLPNSIPDSYSFQNRLTQDINASAETGLIVLTLLPLTVARSKSIFLKEAVTMQIGSCERSTRSKVEHSLFIRITPFPGSYFSKFDYSICILETCAGDLCRKHLPLQNNE